jgi:hypothetical protein
MSNEINYKPIDAENLPPDEAKIAELLGGLRRADAPGDFEFHVKSRVAKGRPAEFSSGGWLPQIKILAPAVLVLVVAALFGSSYLRYPAGGNESGVALAPKDSRPALASEPRPAPPAVIAEPDVEPRTTGSDVVVTKANPKQRQPDGSSIIVVERGTQQRPALGGSRDETGGGSKVVTVRGPSKIINPSGIDLDPVRPNANVAEVANAARNSVSDVLTFLGIDAEKTAAGWRVRSVKADNTAQRSGIKAGDLIEAIEDHELGSSPVIPNNVSFKSLKIIRDGKSLVIALANR